MQQSLLSDFTPVTARPSVFSGRQIADNLGNLLGPLAFGLLAFAFGFRVLLFLVAVMAVVVASMSLRLKEPRRGAQERAGVGATGADLDLDDETLGFRDANRMLRSIATVRLLWRSIPFLFGGVLVILIATPLYLEEEFGFDAADRGIFARCRGSSPSPGCSSAPRSIKRYLFSDQPARMFRLMSGIGVAIAFGIGYLAIVPNVVLMCLGYTVLTMAAALILPAYGTLFSIVFPAPARTVGFAITRVWALPGLIMAPIVGGVGDAVRAAVGHRAQHPDPARRVVDRGDRRERVPGRHGERHEASMAAIRPAGGAHGLISTSAVGSRGGVDPLLGDLEEPGAARVAELEQEERTQRKAACSAPVRSSIASGAGR